MRDALFQGYGGASFTHSSGGGLLEPSNFHGMAALLIKDDVKGNLKRQQKALKRLMTHPVKFNQVVQRTLTCLEREITSSQPTIPSGSTHPDSDSDEDVGNNATMLNPSEFVGAGWPRLRSCVYVTAWRRVRGHFRWNSSYWLDSFT